jgi:hypothetical protein
MFDPCKLPDGSFPLEINKNMAGMVGWLYGYPLIQGLGSVFTY